MRLGNGSVRGRLRRDTVLQLQPALAGTLKIPPAQTGDAPRNRRIPFRFVQPDYFRRRMASQDENENRFHPEGNSSGRPPEPVEVTIQLVYVRAWFTTTNQKPTQTPTKP